MKENEFLNRLLHKGYRLVYDPGAAVYRSLRKSLWAFCYQSLPLWPGRARQMRCIPAFQTSSTWLPPSSLSIFWPLLAVGSPHTPVGPLSFNGLPASALVLRLGPGHWYFSVSWHRRLMDASRCRSSSSWRQFFLWLGLFAVFSLHPKTPSGSGGLPGETRKEEPLHPRHSPEGQTLMEPASPQRFPIRICFTWPSPSSPSSLAGAHKATSPTTCFTILPFGFPP